ncbi:MAG: Ig-like domain-containing protein, partial [Proteobacteria bacterium]|nr:Ig-like domain-containing protein [Pseudomonadota bacterium]
MGQDSTGGGGFFRIQAPPGDTDADPMRPFLASADLGNYFQHLSNAGMRDMNPRLDYGQLKDLAKQDAVYWFALDGNISCSGGTPQIHNPTTSVTACLDQVLAGATAPPHNGAFLFVDTYGTVLVPPNYSGADIDAAPLAGPGALPSFVISDVAAEGILYVAGSVIFTTSGGGASASITSPPELDVHYRDNPLGNLSWVPVEANLPIDPDPTQSRGTATKTVNLRGALYADGRVTFAGSPVIYGAVTAERGFDGDASARPQIWYDYDLRQPNASACTVCGDRPVNLCTLQISPSSTAVEQDLTAQLDALNVIGPQVSWTSLAPGVASVAPPTGNPADVQGVMASPVAATITATDDACTTVAHVEVTPCNLGITLDHTELWLGGSPATATLGALRAVTWDFDPFKWSTLLLGPTTLQVQPLDAGVFPMITTIGARSAVTGATCFDSKMVTVNKCGLTVMAVAPIPDVLRPGVDTANLQASGSAAAVTWSQTSPTAPLLVDITTPLAPLAAQVQASATAASTARVTVAANDANGCTSPGTEFVVCPLAVDAGAGVVDVGATLSLTATGSSGSVAWESSDLGIATVDAATGVVTGQAVGTVTITATDAVSSACTATASVAVSVPALPFEVGGLSIDHNWTAVSFGRTFTEPVVVAKPLNNSDSAYATVRIRNVTPTGFEIRVQEWDYLDGTHGSETLTYLAVERGHHVLPDGTEVEAGTVIATNQSDATIAFTTAFPSVPIILTAVTTANEADAVVTRNRNVSATGLLVHMQEQENKVKPTVNPHASETVSFIAWEAGAGTAGGRSFLAGQLSGVTQALATINFSPAFVAPPFFLADMQTKGGADTANIRRQNLGAGSVQVLVTEEQSYD